MTVRILHVGSFHGNIGDNANHFGFRGWFEGIIGGNVEWQEFEIRDVYRNTRKFDHVFVAAANEVDLVVIGGGNYFELWVDISPTGTSISIEDQDFEGIRTPIFFNALGVDDAQGVTERSRARFGRFMEKLLKSDQFLVSVRNDGSFAALQRHTKQLPLHQVLRLPDGGFFADYAGGDLDSTIRGPHANIRKLRVGINIAGDMLPLRFPGSDDRHEYATFLEEFAKTLSVFADQCPETEFVFFPHIYSDLKVYADLLALLPDKVRRERVVVEKYHSGPSAAAATFTEYCGCGLVLGMRFHSNVVPIGNGVPTIGLCCYPQISRLFEELLSPGDCIDVSRKKFGPLLATRIKNILADYPTAVADTGRMRTIVADARASAGVLVKQWLKIHGLTAGK